MSKCRETFFVDKLFCRLLCLGRREVQQSLPSQQWNRISVMCLRKNGQALSAAWIDDIPSAAPLSLPLPPSHSASESFPMDWQHFHKTYKAWDGYCSPAALTRLCHEPALVPAPALQKEQGSACEIGLCSFWIGTEMLKSNEIYWKDCVCWGGRVIGQRDWVLLLKG